MRWGLEQVLSPGGGVGEYEALVGPHDTVLAHRDSGNKISVDCSASLPQMPAYHLVRKDGLGVTFINIGVG